MASKDNVIHDVESLLYLSGLEGREWWGGGPFRTISVYLLNIY